MTDKLDSNYKSHKVDEPNSNQKLDGKAHKADSNNKIDTLHLLVFDC